MENYNTLAEFGYSTLIHDYTRTNSGLDHVFVNTENNSQNNYLIIIENKVTYN